MWQALDVRRSCHVKCCFETYHQCNSTYTLGVERTAYVTRRFVFEVNNAIMNHAAIELTSFIVERSRQQVWWVMVWRWIIAHMTSGYLMRNPRHETRRSKYLNHTGVLTSFDVELIAHFDKQFCGCCVCWKTMPIQSQSSYACKSTYLLRCKDDSTSHVTSACTWEDPVTSSSVLSHRINATQLTSFDVGKSRQQMRRANLYLRQQCHNIAILNRVALTLTSFIVERSQQHMWRVGVHVRQLRHNKHFRVILSLQQYLQSLMWRVNSTWCDGFFSRETTMLPCLDKRCFESSSDATVLTLFDVKRSQRQMCREPMREAATSFVSSHPVSGTSLTSCDVDRIR
jgi:hypothetical protein